MTHLPYILASYGLAAIMALTLAIGAALRLRRDKARLAALERTDGRKAGAAATAGAAP
ncbi:MAG: heme exporter protein CcmD [Acetobacter sp.]